MVRGAFAYLVLARSVDSGFAGKSPRASPTHDPSGFDVVAEALEGEMQWQFDCDR